MYTKKRLWPRPRWNEGGLQHGREHMAKSSMKTCERSRIFLSERMLSLLLNIFSPERFSLFKYGGVFQSVRQFEILFDFNN